jgi:hypothetical protein
MFENPRGDFELNPRPAELKLIRRAESLARENNPWAEELQRALASVEESRRTSIPDFNFAMSVLGATVQDATNI